MPILAASAIRCSRRATGRTSPVRPTSPHIAVRGSRVRSRVLLRMAPTTARSTPGILEADAAGEVEEDVGGAELESAALFEHGK